MRTLSRLKNKLAAVPVKLFAESRLERRWREHTPGPLDPSHHLPGELVVNLTSFPPRFSALHLTLRSLLVQTVKPDRVVLWIFERDEPLLPDAVRELRAAGLTIETCPADLRSYKKLVPALERWPEAYHVTADDDLYYRPDWLEELLSGYRGNDDEVLCLRAHYVRTDRNGDILPYRRWETKTEERGPDDRLFCTGGAGVLYPPGSLHPDVTDASLFMRLAPYADDIWFYWMVILNGTGIRRVGRNRKIIAWKSHERASLWRLNKQPGTGNDVQFRDVARHYAGRPRPGARRHD